MTDLAYPTALRMTALAHLTALRTTALADLTVLRMTKQILFPTAGAAQDSRGETGQAPSLRVCWVAVSAFSWMAMPAFRK